MRWSLMLFLFVSMLSAAAASGAVRNIHTTFGADASSEITISWAGGTSSGVRYGLTTAMAQSATGVQQGIHHHARLAGLVPGATYYFECGGEASATGSFEMGPAGPVETFTFAVPGDVQGRVHGMRWEPQSDFFLSQGAKFWVPVGDLVQEGEEQYQWDDAFYGPAVPLATTAPLMPVRGNHDLLSQTVAGDECNGLYSEQMSLPENGDDARYWFEYADALFVTLDTYCADSGEEAAWLEGVLAQSTKRWIFVFVHRPIYSTGGHGGVDLLGSLNALMEQYEVNAVFSGHAHTMSVNAPIHDGEIVSSYADGVLYFNTAGTNFNYDRDDYAPGAKPFQTYLQPGPDIVVPMATMVTVRADTATVTTYDYLDGSVYHSVTLPARRFASGAVASGAAPEVPLLSLPGLATLVSLLAGVGASSTAVRRRRVGAPS